MTDLFQEVFKKAYEVSEPPVTQGDEEPTVVVQTIGEEDEEEQEGKEKFSSVAVLNFFANPESHPLVLDLALLQKYGIDWLGWETETLELRIPQDFKSSVSELNLHKIQACKTLHLVDTYWTNWEVFLPCTTSFNAVMPSFEVMQVPTVAHCMVSVDIANKIRDDVPFSSEISTFLAVVHRHDEIFCSQPPLDFVTIDVDGLPFDCSEVQKLWPDSRSQKRALGSGIVQEQIRRMLLVYDYLEDFRTSLQQQLRFLIHLGQ